MDTISETRTEPEVQVPQESASEATEVQEQTSEGQATEAASKAQESSQAQAQPDLRTLLEQLPETELRKIPKLQSLLDRAAEAERLKAEIANIQRQLEENQRRQQRERTRQLREQAKGLDPDAKAEQYDRLLAEQEFLERLEEEAQKRLEAAQKNWQIGYSQAVMSFAQQNGLTADEVTALARQHSDYSAFWSAVTEAITEKKLAKEREKLQREAEELAEARLKAKENDAKAARDQASRGPLTTESTGPARLDWSRMSDEEFAKYQREYEADPIGFQRRYFRRG